MWNELLDSNSCLENPLLDLQESEQTPKTTTTRCLYKWRMNNIAPHIYLAFRVLLFKISTNQSRQCMYNVTMKCVTVTIVAVEKQ